MGFRETSHILTQKQIDEIKTTAVNAALDEVKAAVQAKSMEGGDNYYLHVDELSEIIDRIKEAK